MQVVPTPNTPGTPVPEAGCVPLEASRVHTLRRVLDGRFRLLYAARTPEDRLQSGPPRLYAATWLDRSQVAIRRCSRHPDPRVPLAAFDEQFDRACRALEALDHPSIGRFLTHGYDRAHDERYIAQTWIHGVDIAALRAALGRPLEPVEAAALLLPIADALVYCHDRGVAHGGLDARSVLLTTRASSATGLPSGLTLVGLCPERQVAADRAAQQTQRLDTRPDTVALATLAYGLTAGIGPFSLGLSPSQQVGITPIDTPDARWNAILGRVFSPGSPLRMRDLRDLFVGLVVGSPATLDAFTPMFDATVAELLATRLEPELPTTFDGPMPDPPIRPVGATPTATPPPPRERDAAPASPLALLPSRRAGLGLLLAAVVVFGSVWAF
jgi:hypothetical protein